MKSISFVLLLFYFLLPISIVAGNSGKQISLQLQKEARKAFELGEVETARVLFKKAKKADKTVELPGWVTDEGSPEKTQSIIAHQLISRKDGARLLFNFQARPDETSRKLLETYLRLYPDEEEIRNQFEHRIKMIGQETDLKPREDNLNKNSAITMRDFKTFILIMLIILLLWQSCALIYEYFFQNRKES